MAIYFSIVRSTQYKVEDQTEFKKFVHSDIGDLTIATLWILPILIMYFKGSSLFDKGLKYVNDTSDARMQYIQQQWLRAPQHPGQAGRLQQKKR